MTGRQTGLHSADVQGGSALLPGYSVSDVWSETLQSLQKHWTDEATLRSEMITFRDAVTAVPTFKHCGWDLLHQNRAGMCMLFCRCTTSTLKHSSQTRPRPWCRLALCVKDLQHSHFTIWTLLLSLRIISPTFSLLWSDPSSALCPGSFAGWRGCRPVWILGRFWCKGPAWRRTARYQRCQGFPTPRVRSPPRSPCGKSPL